MGGVLGRAWSAASFIATVYMIMKQLQAMKEAKDQFYSSLSPEHQAEYRKIFQPDIPLSFPSFPEAVVPTSESVKAGA
jgi:hypothetical protein